MLESIKSKQNLFVEICDNDESRSRGLMYRKYLGENQGMLFCFSSENRYSFWMKNTYIPLDIAFISASGEIVDIKPMYPLSTRSVSSSKPFLFALEVNSGWFDKNGVGVGYRIWGDIKKASAEGPEVSLLRDFKTCVDLSVQNGWNMLITYRFRPVEYIKGKPVQRSGEKPEINDYQIILDGKTKLRNGKPFEYEDSGNGEYIAVPCFNASGEPRCFFIDGIVDFRFFSNGKTFVDPREIQPMNKRKNKRLRPDRNPSLEGIQSIWF